MTFHVIKIHAIVFVIFLLHTIERIFWGQPSGPCVDGFNIVDYDSGIILFHYARNQSEHFCWEAMETFKDGMGFSRKNHSRMKRWGRVHVLVFSNSFPDPEGKLTPDRLVIHDLASEPSFV